MKRLILHILLLLALQISPLQVSSSENSFYHTVDGSNWNISTNSNGIHVWDELVVKLDNQTNDFKVNLPSVSGNFENAFELHEAIIKSRDVHPMKKLDTTPEDARNYRCDTSCDSDTEMILQGERTRLSLNKVAMSKPFITKWKTDNTTWDPTIINITTDPDRKYNYTIDWGDGNIENGITGDITHDYGIPGTYTVEISGIFPRFLLTRLFDRFKIVAIEQWGDIEWASMEMAFDSCPNLKVNATDIPNLSNVTSLRSMFGGCRIMTGTTAFQNWDVSQITNMDAMFTACHLFNQDLGAWDVSNVTDFQNMFYYTKSFNHDLSSWNVSKATQMSRMFEGARVFNQNIGNWDISNVTTTEGMFRDAISFDQDLGKWDVTALTNASNMFDNIFLSTANYDALLIGWNAQNLNKNISFSGGFSQYCSGKTARKNMIAADNWTIIDEGSAGLDVVVSPEITECISYTLPVLNSNNNYFTATNGGGTKLYSGDIITTSQTIYIFTTSGSAPNICTDESKFEVTIGNAIPPENLTDITTCESYILPDLTEGNRYYTAPNAEGASLNAGDSITSTQTIFIYSGAAGCSNESTFQVTIDAPTCEQPIDTETCEIEFPKFITPNGDGNNDRFEFKNNDCGFTGELRIFDRLGNLVYQTNNLDTSWDGTLNGRPVTASTYWYQFIDSASGKITTKYFAIKR
jgi:gliding motility-associated-like protein